MNLMKKFLVTGVLCAMAVNIFANGTAETQSSGSIVDQIKARGVVKVATGTYVPFEFRDAKTDKIVGFDIDLAQLIADKLGVKLEVSDMPFTTIIPSVEKGDYDFSIAAMYDTPARRKIVLMSDSYMKTGMVLVAKKGNPLGIKTLQDCNGLKVGVKAGATSQKVAEDAKEKYGLNYKIVGYDETVGCVSDLEVGRVDAVVNDLLNELELEKVHPGVEIVSDDPFTTADLACATKIGNDDLMKIINEVIATYKTDGTYDKLYQKWLK
ncbi:MAG: ABC transporter substrate-binding protein [Spirochaetia bacterium]|nr:ABC transporter substrate-binding protein [Spirochaetia bacterium]